MVLTSRFVLSRLHVQYGVYSGVPKWGFSFLFGMIEEARSGKQDPDLGPKKENYQFARHIRQNLG